MAVVVEMKTKSGETISANFLISASGVLNVPQKPTFKNENTFKGIKYHSFDWPEEGSENEVNYTNKKVSIIGTGATAVQILPRVAQKAKSVTIFQRSAAWAPPKIGAGKYETNWKDTFKSFPFINRLYRWYLYWNTEQSYFLFIKRDTYLQRKTISVLKHLTKKLVNSRENPDLAKKLTPSYEPGCKRITPSDHYLKAFRKPNVHLMDVSDDPIEEFTENSIKTKSGNETESDIIIFATGFSMLKAMDWFDIYGFDTEKKQSDLLGDTPQMYYGICAPGYPNFFRILGPNAGLAHNSIIFMIEAQVEYICESMRHLMNSKKSSMVIKKSVQEEHYKYIYKSMPGKAFGGDGGCYGWYRNEKNICWTMWPNSCTNYWWQLLICKFSEFVVE